MVPRHCSVEGKEPAVSVNIMQIFEIATVTVVGVSFMWPSSVCFRIT